MLLDSRAYVLLNENHLKSRYEKDGISGFKNLVSTFNLTLLFQEIVRRFSRPIMW